ncbi:hypothetical protein ABZ470_11960 [Streptosporangium sp. NPDC020072]|uniref:hypothetical protein n=1 Tax=Streptosporangium sp. NPDC020072 TaxID=3154788 RepID=UPI00342AFE1F
MTPVAGPSIGLRDLAALRFPLVARPRPICRPLDIRLNQIQARADQAEQGGDDALLRAAEALNLAALLASDCGMPHLARDLCRRQFVIFHAARPLTAAHAQLALQPAVNLGRIHIRNGDGQRAFHLFHTLFAALQNQGTADLDGDAFSLRRFLRTTDDRRETSQWLWQVVLSEGTRALTRAGQWQEALTYATELRGIGLRLWEGRQITILTQVFGNAPDAALDLLDHTEINEPWEAAVHSCLVAMALRAAGRKTGSHAPQTLATYLDLEPDLTLVDFRTRLGLTIIDILAEDEVVASPIYDRLLTEATGVGGAHSAREVLTHPGFRARLAPARISALKSVIKAAALDDAQALEGSMEPFLHAVRRSESAAKHRLTGNVTGHAP